MTDYGRDLSCTDKLRINRYVSGLRVVAEALYRRFTARKGELFYDPEYGEHVGDYLGTITSSADVAALPGKLRQQALRDRRIESIDVDVVEIASGPERAWTITIQAYTGKGPFELVIGVEGVTVSLLGVTV